MEERTILLPTPEEIEQFKVQCRAAMEFPKVSPEAWGDPDGDLVPLPAKPEPSRVVPELPLSTYRYLTRLV